VESTTTSSDSFPTLSRLGIPVKYNYAGIPFVSWSDLARHSRRLLWEQEVTRRAQPQPGMAGLDAYQTEHIFKMLEERDTTK